ncbi:MAG TPA: YggT family protein [Candidatus Desulfobacillus sp.]|nr:YggT family protein [Candidatus Desulfobacillus sp.]
MLASLLLMVLEAVSGFFVLLLLVRFHMQWLRVPFRNRVGQFVVAATDWLVRPARRIVPALGGLDLASLASALLLHAAYLAAAFWLQGFSFGAHAGLAPLALAALAALGLLRFSLYLLIGVVLVAAVLSWVNPRAPLAPLFDSLCRPFLRPFRRLIPPIAQVDLSPLVLLLLLQVVLMLLAWLRLPLVNLLA